jgi:holo-[acyl-carrier protein] synthase
MACRAELRPAGRLPTERASRKVRRVIVGLGLDVVRVERVEGLLRRHGERALRRLFTEDEVRRCRGSRHPGESFAARFAAKEAAFKALGTGWGRGGAWTDVEVVSAAGGAPSLRLSGAAASAARARRAARFHLSLSHGDGTAVAVVVLEAAEGEGRAPPR